MAKPNYAFAKRQRDLAKKQKKEEKKLRKAGSATEGADGMADPADDSGPDRADPAGEQVRQETSLATEQAGPLSGDPVSGERHSGRA